MRASLPLRRAVQVALAGAGVAAATYAAWVAASWLQYGRPSPAADGERDELLDRFMPRYDVVERHHIRVDAPADVTLAAAKEQDLLQLPPVRAIFKMRELAVGAVPDPRPQPRALLAQMQALGWGVLAEIPGRALVAGAVTKPWEANVTFRALPPDDFAAFAEPGFVKIVWTLRADPIGRGTSVFRTETRAAATDAAAAATFRRYWAFAAPGITTIRWLSLRPLKRAAERLVATRLEEGRVSPVSAR